MAVDRKQFVHKVDVGIKADKTYQKFYLSFKLDEKVKQKVVDFSEKQWDKKTRVSQAKRALQSLKDKQVDTGVNFTENTKLNDVADIFFTMACDDTNWTKSRKDTYTLYCSSTIGKKPIKNIRQVDIDKLRKSMETKGYSKQNENGCSPRTIKKVLIQIVKPILQYAKDNKVIDDIPTIKTPKQRRQKKLVVDATGKMTTLYTTIMSMYQDNAFYKGLFLFALYGRRWNEIRTLQWSDINKLNATYTIRAENNKIGQDQTYELSRPIIDALSQIKDNHIGLIFKSPVTGKELYPPKKQLARLKEQAGIAELTMHYFRHILVSAMGEAGTANTILSASLGHTNSDTVNQFYLSANHTKASKEANLTIEQITQGKES